MADTLDVITLPEAKKALSIKAASTDQDTEIAAYITTVSRRLDQACGAVVRRTITSERHDGGDTTICLEHPAYSISSVTEYQRTTAVPLTAETLGTAPADGYLAEPHDPDPTLLSGVLTRRAGGYTRWFYPGNLNIAITYSAGRYAVTATVDTPFKTAAYIILRNLWASEEPSVAMADEFDVPNHRFPRFAVPNAARQLLSREWREIPGLA